MCSRAPELRIYFVEQPQHFHHWKQEMVTMKMLWSSLNMQVQTLHDRSHSCCERGTVKTESFQAGSHTYHTSRLFLKTPENILKYPNFMGRNVILNFYNIDIYSLFTKTLNDRPFVPAAAVIFYMTWKKYIYENFKRKLLRGIVNSIKNNTNVTGADLGRECRGCAGPPPPPPPPPRWPAVF